MVTSLAVTCSGVYLAVPGSVINLAVPNSVISLAVPGSPYNLAGPRQCYQLGSPRLCEELEVAVSVISSTVSGKLTRAEVGTWNVKSYIIYFISYIFWYMV
jgi:hypothetical protein